MSGTRRPLLLVAYKYPPYAGVGGYRWAKLSKYLARLGHQVHVVTVDWPRYGPNTLVDDVREPGIEIHRIPSGSPLRLRHRPLAGRWTAAARHVGLRAVDRVLYFDDEAQRWGRHLVPFCERLIAERGIEVAVATGHPFQANRFAAELRRRTPALALIQDFRDPWGDNPFRRLTARQRARVRDWQSEAVAAADAVVAVTEGLLELYVGPDSGDRGVVIPNGVDPEAVPAAGAEPPATNAGAIRLTHVGNVGNGRDRPLGALLEALRSLPAGGRRIELSLVGGGLEAVRRAHADLIERGVLAIRPPMAQTDALALVAASDYALQLNAREFPYLVSTKVYEYALLRVPAISLNYGGEVDALVRERGFGHSIDLSANPDLRAFLGSLRKRAHVEREFAFDVEPFTYPRLAQTYSGLIDSVR